ncbi:hypothetical protein HMPREF9058_2107 [Actinomyces sp. oral taxon 175 str. F0384]|nr:hypothetical protein HMPREF9058_2107 [Actinomyces sp. oral taxon 175 str. F0384]
MSRSGASHDRLTPIGYRRRILMLPEPEDRPPALAEKRTGLKVSR